ncbi:hypothetical protein AOE01nite_30140 [Acetobacter oeni]|uniref:P-type conjugative transfer protein TrbG n=1 Tax=Acetobacter oeni TaxID=304077 RepID=A0A511XPA3_9PROT|nr:hypothetical protein [Acetobacter oeni]GBR03678.1 conjugal transfer protein TrbG [Acetobacter oeni LMG 21952]GEN64790.1 hypothetical protein AOE01nite_30140 [Acetobacter oeni]
MNAVQVYPYSPGALYQVYAAPGEITDIMLQQGEKLVGTGPVAAGDTVRWIIGDTESGAGATKRIHILVKPTRPDLTANLIVNTDRRTYLAELRSTPATYMASVSWDYPEDDLIALNRQNDAADDATRALVRRTLARGRRELAGGRTPTSASCRLTGCHHADNARVFFLVRQTHKSCDSSAHFPIGCTAVPERVGGGEWGMDVFAPPRKRPSPRVPSPGQPFRVASSLPDGSPARGKPP